VLAIHDGAFPELVRKAVGEGVTLDLGWVSGAICMSEPIREVFTRLAPGVPAVHLSPLIDDSLPAPDTPLPASVGELFSANDAVVCGSGALAAHYGLADLLEAHAALCSAGRRVGLLLLLGSFVRETSIEEKLHEAVASAGDDRIQVLTDYPEGPAAIARSNVYVRPSRVESFGLALHEALLAGVPVVAAHHPTRPAGVIGYEPGDIAGLVAAIDRGLTPEAVAGARSLADDERIRVRDNRDRTLDFLRACR
jgi:glycosyltransferase involved in cell wall biosynthesis